MQVCSLRLTGAAREAASLPGAADLRVCLSWYGVFDARKIRCCPARAPGMHPDLSAGFAGPVTALGSVLLPPTQTHAQRFRRWCQGTGKGRNFPRVSGSSDQADRSVMITFIRILQD